MIWALQRHTMLAIDIETLGLPSQKPLPPITCICLYDGEKEHTFLFYSSGKEAFHQEEDDFKPKKAKVIELLDSAECIVGFNAVCFDLEYIKLYFGLPQAQLAAWIKKTLDPFMSMKHLLGKTCSLKSILAMNGLPSKSGSGLEAIQWAKEVPHSLNPHYSIFTAVFEHICDRAKWILWLSTV